MVISVLDAVVRCSGWIQWLDAVVGCCDWMLWLDVVLDAVVGPVSPQRLATT